jgi:hypothetical protein
MKLIVILIFSLAFKITTFAQEIPRAQIEDSIIGWMKIYNFKGVKEGISQDGKFYSAAQLSLCDSFANWIQASYIPKGGLGDVKKVISEKIGLYNKHQAGLPQSYGAYAITYLFLKRNSQNKFAPVNNLGVNWTIRANEVPTDFVIRDLSTSTECYFTLPGLDSKNKEESWVKKHDLAHIENLKPYSTFWLQNAEVGGGTDYVMLSKDNKSPFVKLTRGEYLVLLEKAIPVVYEREKKKIYENNKDNQKSIDYFMKYLDDQTEKRKVNLKKLQDKYKGRLGEVALVTIQPTILDLDNGRDVFSNGYLADPEETTGRMPVYKVDPTMAEGCKTDKPQWVMVSWIIVLNNPTEKTLHEAITNNFNFDYLYKFCFAPEQVKGIAYRPLRSPAYKEAVVISEASAAKKKNAGDNSVFFFEDFSTTAEGKSPLEWKSKLNTEGKACTVTRIDGEPGNWVELKGNELLIPTQIKKPFPQNFTLTYDIIVPQNFTWGGKGLSFQLSKETSPGNAESYLNLRLRPGYDGKDGEAVIEAKFPAPPGYLNGSKWLGAPGFSNNKKNNHIVVTIRKSGETLQLFIGKDKIAEYQKAIPDALLFNAISFGHGRSDGETEKYYVSNIRITKE